MGKIISSILEDCVFSIHKDRKFNRVFKPNFKVINFIKTYINQEYEFHVLSNLCHSDYQNVGIDILFNQENIPFKKIYYACDRLKADIIINEIKPTIYIDNHIELCAGLQMYNIDTYLLTENECVKNNKCATGLKIL